MCQWCPGWTGSPKTKLDTESPESHDVTVFQYWTVFPSNKVLWSAKVFLLGQVIYLSESSKPVNSSIKENPNLSTAFNVYEYQADSSTCTPAGKSGLLKTACNLHINVSHLISNTKDGVRLDKSVSGRVRNYIQ